MATLTLAISWLCAGISITLVVINILQAIKINKEINNMFKENDNDSN